MNRKRLLTYLATLTILVSLIGPLMFVSTGTQATEPDSYYKLMPGVLNTDGYLNYPFETGTNLTIGFSKFGEMIDSKDNVGLEYGDVDPFAPPGGKGVGSIVKGAWVQGWLCNITYYHKVKGSWRNVWAGALFSDGTTFNNGSWIRVDFTNDYSTTYGLESFTDPGAFIGAYAMGYTNHGGRKTNGTCVTKDIQVLYNGSRRFIALMNTTVYDHFEYRTDPGVEDIPLLDVVITIIFDKVKKSVVLLKDIKTKVSSKYATEMKVQFSNRGEVDLGTETAGYASYFHFYTEGISAYNNLTNGMIEWTVTPAHPPPYDNAHEGLSTVYNWNYVLNQTESPNWPSSYTGSYKNYTTYGPNPNATGLFDLATAINPAAGYYWYAAFWPILSDWSIDGWNEKWRSMTPHDPHYIDAGAPSLWDEPDVPFYIGEWDFLLHPRIVGGKNQQFRFVTVYGVNNLHEDGTLYTWEPHDIPVGGGSDYHQGGGAINRIDREAAYQLNEVFNPWDLYAAVEKQELRWVYKSTLSSAASYITLTDGLDVAPYKSSFITSYVNGTAAWNYTYSHSKNWSAKLTVPVNRTSNDGAVVGVPYGDILCHIGEISFWYYKPSGDEGIFPYVVLDIDYDGDGVIDHWLVNAFTWPKLFDAWTQGKPSGLHNVTGKLTYMGEWNLVPDIAGFEPGYANWTYWKNSTLATKKVVNVKVDYGFSSNASSTGAVVYIDDIKITCTTHSLEDGKVVPHIWDKYCGFAERVFVNGTLQIPRRAGYTASDLDYDINFVTGVVTFYDETGATRTLLAGSTVKVLYSTLKEDEKGRYEWSVVGSTSAAVDSAGLAMVSAAFKNKEVEVENSGLDCQDTTFGSRVPYMLAKYGHSGNYPIGYGKHPEKTYYDSIGRLYLRDDWCTNVSISSSNIISVGSGMANLLSEYFNDFTDAFIYSKLGDGIMSVSCWNRTLNFAGTFIYPGGTINDRYGYAVVTTYKDINGTIGFIIYGWTGQDTYFACRWFNVGGFYNMAGTWLNKNGAEYLQTENRGVTTLILRITYKTAAGVEVCPPTVRIMERLGTISEKTPHDP